MKDYNSIPFKNKAIDRLTNNTTIVPGTQNNGTQIQEVKVTPNPKDVSWQKSMNPRGVAYPLYPTKITSKNYYDTLGSLVDNRPYKETPEYEADKAKAKAAKKQKSKNDAIVSAGILGSFLGMAGGTLLQDLGSKSERKARRESRE